MAQDDDEGVKRGAATERKKKRKRALSLL